MPINLLKPWEVIIVSYGQYHDVLNNKGKWKSRLLIEYKRNLIPGFPIEHEGIFMKHLENRIYHDKKVIKHSRKADVEKQRSSSTLTERE